MPHGLHLAVEQNDVRTFGIRKINHFLVVVTHVTDVSYTYTEMVYFHILSKHHVN